MSEKSLEIFGLLNEEVDPRMELLLNLARDVSNAAVRLVSPAFITLIFFHSQIIYLYVSFKDVYGFKRCCQK